MYLQMLKRLIIQEVVHCLDFENFLYLEEKNIKITSSSRVFY